MMLNTSKTSFLGKSGDSDDSEEFILTEDHLKEAHEMDKKVENRVKNIIKLALVSNVKNLKETTSIKEEFGCSESKKLNFANKKERVENEKWKNLLDDLTWFVIYNEKLKSDLPHHNKPKIRADKVNEARGTYYGNALRKKIITLNLVRWFKNRLRIKVKKGERATRFKWRLAKYKIMKNLIVKRLLKDMIACGIFSYLRKKIIELKQGADRNHMRKKKFAENRYRFLVQQQLTQTLKERLAKASKFSVQRRKLRTLFINRRLTRIQKDLKKHVSKQIRFGVKQKEKDHKFKYWIHELHQKLVERGQITKDPSLSTFDTNTLVSNIISDVINQKDVASSQDYDFLDNLFKEKNYKSVKQSFRRRKSSVSNIKVVFDEDTMMHKIKGVSTTKLLQRPSVLVENDKRRRTLTENLLKSSKKRHDRSMSDDLLRRLKDVEKHPSYWNFKASVMRLSPLDSDEEPTSLYKEVVEDLRRREKSRSTVSIDPFPHFEKSITSYSPLSKVYSFENRQKTIVKAKEAEKKKLEKTVLRSKETRFKEMKLREPKDKDFRITNILGGSLARHAWKKFYTGKDVFKSYEKIPIVYNSRKSLPCGKYEIYKPLKPDKRILYLLVVHGFDLTPRKFKSSKYPSCNVRYDTLTFFSSVLRDSEKLRKDGKIKERVESIKTSSSTPQSRTWTEDRIPPAYLPFTNKSEELSEEDPDVPPMFSLRQELCAKNDPYDRENLKFRVFLSETETIELINVESKLETIVEERKSKSPVRKKSLAFEDSGSTVKSSLSKTTLKRKKSIGSHRIKFRKGRLSKQSSTLTVNTPSTLTLDLTEEIEIEDHKESLFFDKSVQVVGPSSFPAHVQVSAPKRKNCATNVTMFDLSNKEEMGFVEKASKSIFSRIHDNVDSTSEEADNTEEPVFALNSEEFKESIRDIKRVLVSNTYRKAHNIYSDFYVNPYAEKLSISYHCVDLWTFHDYRIQLSQLRVSGIATHPFDKCIIAVGYDKKEFSYNDQGAVCIWNVKNISEPEKIIKFNSSVTYLEFSHPTTISVATMSGYVAVINICEARNPILSTERTLSSFLPVWQFTWFVGCDGNKFPVSCGADGRLYRYRLDGTFAPTVIMEAKTKEGNIKGLDGKHTIFRTPIIRERPEMTFCVQHPTDRLTYFTGTSDGSVHICSLNLKTHTDVFLAQYGRINSIKFHPSCEYIFLTVGGDFTVRIWSTGIFEPLFTLSPRNEYVEDACFNHIWPELMISISGEYVDIWNIRRKVDVPVQSWVNPKQLKNTSITCSTDGYSIIVGDIGGYVHVFKLTEMPCESKFKAEVLSDAIKTSLSGRKDIIAALSKLGYPFSFTPTKEYEKKH